MRILPRGFGLAEVGLKRLPRRLAAKRGRIRRCERAIWAWRDGAIGAEKSDDPLWLLERLNQLVQQNPVKTAIMPIDAVFVVLVEGIHGRLPAKVLATGS